RAVVVTRPFSPRPTPPGWRPSDTAVVLPLLGYAAEQLAHLGLPVTTVAAEGPDGRDLPGLGPPGDRLRVDTEQRGHLGRGEQRVRLALTWVHERTSFQALPRIGPDTPMLSVGRKLRT